MRVLVVDDNDVIREHLVSILERTPNLQSVGTARSGAEAVELTERLRPDAVVLDAYMPGMNGADAARMIMERTPTPIVILNESGLDARIAAQAIAAGALIVLDKPVRGASAGSEAAERQLVDAVRLIGGVKVIRRQNRQGGVPSPADPAPIRGRELRLVAIGASTGGPNALLDLFAGFVGPLAIPVLIVQHISEGFSASMVECLRQGYPSLKLAEHDEPLRSGTAYLAPDGYQMGASRQRRIALSKDPPEGGFRPSVNYLFRTVAEVYGSRAAGVLLSGMGKDGAEGLLRLRKAGGMTIAQSQESSVVFGMPGEAIRLGAAHLVLPPRQIAQAVCSWACEGRDRV